MGAARRGRRSAPSPTASSSSRRAARLPAEPAGRPRRLRGGRRCSWRAARRRAHLVGHSYGGVIALLAAARAARRGPLAHRDRAAGDAGRARRSRRSTRSRPRGAELWRTGRADDPEAFLRGSSRPSARRTIPRRRSPRSSSRAPALLGRARAVGGRDPARRARGGAVPEARRLGGAPPGLRRRLRRARADSRPSARPARVRAHGAAPPEFNGAWRTSSSAPRVRERRSGAG